MGGRRNLRQRLRSAERERDHAKNKNKSTKNPKGMVREAREIDCNYRDMDSGGIIEEIINMSKDMERYQDKADMYSTAFSSAKAELCRLASAIDGVRRGQRGPRPIGSTSLIEATEGRERD